MEFKDHFLLVDVESARKEAKCLNDCLVRAVEKVEAGDIENAELHIIDALKSLGSLKDYSLKKQSTERELVHDSVDYAPEKSWF